MNKIPKQLQVPEFRFYLCKPDSKLPMEKKYNTENNYPFFHEKVKEHSGNIGILTGKHNLIVIDYDDESYYQQTCQRLPFTFTVRSAKKKKAHMYYYLKGEMFRYFGIDKYYDNKMGYVITNLKRITAIDKVRGSMKAIEFQEWLKSHNLAFKRVCDVMADGGRIICPNSVCDRAYYDIAVDSPIMPITREELENVFQVNLQNISFKRKNCDFFTKSDIKKVEMTIIALEKIGLKRSMKQHFNCPFHDSEGGKCLSIMDSGMLHCFHCGKTWQDVQYLIDDMIQSGWKI